MFRNPTKIDKMKAKKLDLSVKLEALSKVSNFKAGSGPVAPSLDMTLQKHNIQRQKYHGTSFVGNDCNKYLQKEVFHDVCATVISKTEELSQSPSIRSEGIAELTHPPSIRSEATAELTHSPSIRSEATAELTHSPSIRSEATAELTNSPSIRSKATAELTHSPSIRSEATAELTHSPSSTLEVSIGCDYSCAVATLILQGVVRYSQCLSDKNNTAKATAPVSKRTTASQHVSTQQLLVLLLLLAHGEAVYTNLDRVTCQSPQCIHTLGECNHYSTPESACLGY